VFSNASYHFGPPAIAVVCFPTRHLIEGYPLLYSLLPTPIHAVTVCCSLLQCVAACCSVLQRVAAYCSVSVRSFLHTSQSTRHMSMRIDMCDMNQKVLQYAIAAAYMCGMAASHV